MNEGKMYSSKMMIVVRRDLKMRKGKIAAQAGHAAVEATLRAILREGRASEIRYENGQIKLDTSDSTPLTRWFSDGEAKICVCVNSLDELLAVDAKLKAAGLISALIEDAGCTEFHGEPTFTCLASEPAPAEVLDPITGSLPLF